MSSIDRVVHPELEIGVINHTLLKQIPEDSAPNNEEGRLIREEGIPWEEVKQIRIEYRSKYFRIITPS